MQKNERKDLVVFQLITSEKMFKRYSIIDYQPEKQIMKSTSFGPYCWTN